MSAANSTDSPLPPGKIQVKVTFLEMKHAPSGAPLAPPRADVSVMHAAPPTISFYRYLYDRVGREWLWIDRHKLSDSALAEIICDPRNEVNVLYVAGTPAGMAEIDRRNPQDVELVYFGIMREFFGLGLGKYFLDWTIRRAWEPQTKRFWLHTCTLDHPRALDVYRKGGFTAYKEETKVHDTWAGQEKKITTDSHR